jgi:hypothetical protein
VQERERATHDSLQYPRATRDIDALCWNQLQERKRAVAKRSDGEIERQNREQRTEAKQLTRPFHHASIQ